MPKGTNDKVLAQNRKANHDYTILETIEAGMVLTGTEIKSVRQARINLKDGYVSLKQGEAFLVGVHISPFEQGTLFNHDPLRTRKLLLHKKQINYLLEQVKQAGNTVVPLKVYIKNGVAKLLIGVAKGKKNYDKRDALKQKDMKREIDRKKKKKRVKGEAGGAAPHQLFFAGKNILLPYMVIKIFKKEIRFIFVSYWKCKLIVQNRKGSGRAHGLEKESGCVSCSQEDSYRNIIFHHDANYSSRLGGPLDARKYREGSRKTFGSIEFGLSNRVPLARRKH